MDFRIISDELNLYAANNFKPFADRFKEKQWDNGKCAWVLSKNDLCFSQILVKFTSSDLSLSLAIWNDEAFEELKNHADNIRNSYGVNVGNNQECSCTSIKKTDWNDNSSKIDSFDWVIMNTQILQDIVDRYLSDYEVNEIQKGLQRGETIAQNRDAELTTDKGEDYETKKVFAETNNKNGVRYKIIHRKSKNRYEIWSSNHGIRKRVNNNDIEIIKMDKDAMICYVKDNLLI